MRVLPYGDRALLVEVDSLDEVLALYPRLVSARRGGIVELVPAARSLLIVLDPAVLSLGAVERWIAVAAAGPAGAPHAASDDDRAASSAAPAVVAIPVHYDGEDLAEVAALLGTTTAGVVREHCAAVWHVAFSGFAPGFAYLARPGRPLDVPRRPTSRERVPAGAVGLAGEFSGIYPRSSPGGWQLIGHTDAVLWDTDRARPALLSPGTAVRFVDADAPVRGDPG